MGHRPIRHMKKEDALAHISQELKKGAEQRVITVSMLDDDNRRDMAKWIYENFRV